MEKPRRRTFLEEIFDPHPHKDPPTSEAEEEGEEPKFEYHGIFL